MARTRVRTRIFFVLVGAAGLVLPNAGYAATCEAILGKWAWFIGGEVTVNRDGTFTQQSGNAGRWECKDGARGRFTFRWRDGGFVNSLAVSPDGQGLTSTDQSQAFVTAQRSAPAPPPPPPVRQEECCREAYYCETHKIEAAFDQKTAQCHHPGNAGCFQDAVRTKASQLKAAGEQLRLCNRAASGELSRPVPGTGGAASTAAGNDEFHSSEGTGNPAQSCQPCQIITSGQETTPPEAESPTFPPLKTGTEENVTIPDVPVKPLDERWKDWAKDYNDQVAILLRDFGPVIPNDGNDYSYTAMVRVSPNGTIQVGEPVGSAYARPKPGQTTEEAERIAKKVLAEHLPMFKQYLVTFLQPLPFPKGSRLAWWAYPATYKRSKADTPFTPAPTPKEPPPPRSTQKRSR